ncbi:Bud-site selection protein, partial [Pseudomassariella vexata]
MAKRKREPSLQENLSRWEQKLMQALKTAKGFERQRLSKRIRDPTTTPEKIERLEREVVVLKSLDLHQASRAHICSSLLKIKGIAESPNLPEFIRPVSKPNLPVEESTALHNVTSALYNRKQVRDIIEEAVTGVSQALRVPLLGKKGKGKSKTRQEPDEQVNDRQGSIGEDKMEGDASKRRKLDDRNTKSQLGKEEESWSGFSDETRGDVSGNEVEESALPRYEGALRSQKNNDPDDSESEDNSFAEEKAFLRYDCLLGNSADENSSESDGEAEDLQISRVRSIQNTRAEDWSGGSSDDEMYGDSESDEEQEQEQKEEDGKDSDTPPPQKTRPKASKMAPTSTGNSTFLPSLYSGYISGDESASDVDVAPVRKNRRGQRARQAIWEKKYKEQAKHVQNQKEKNARDQGWDMRKGAVGEDEGPWKKGIQNPFSSKAGRPQNGPEPRKVESGSNGLALGVNRRDVKSQEKPKPKHDNLGALHPSWEAAKKAKEAAQKVEFKGKKVVF